jgi:hypothetical protein
MIRRCWVCGHRQGLRCDKADDGKGKSIKMGFLRLNSLKMGFSMRYTPSTRVDNSWNILFMG